MKTKIKKLKDDWVMPTEDEYVKAKNKYVSNYTTYKSRFLGGGYENDPLTGEAKWNSIYPSGYNSWAGNQGKTFNAYGEHLMVAKINELIDIINKK
jgi:hypothetical protein